jgi:hypothetical protein
MFFSFSFSFSFCRQLFRLFGFVVCNMFADFFSVFVC